MSDTRNAEYSIQSFLLKRWSPRSFAAEPMPDVDLFSLFEAAKWAPSSYNNQPWRFLYAKRDGVEWPLFFNCLVPVNQTWAKNASALVLVVSATKFDHNGNSSRTHSFDAGAAWENLALEAWLKGYVAHAMEGFDYEKARTDLAVPPDFNVEAMIAIGKQGPKESLPEQLQEIEAPNTRRPISASVAKGKFASHLVHTEK